MYIVYRKFKKFENDLQCLTINIQIFNYENLLYKIFFSEFFSVVHPRIIFV